VVREVPLTGGRPAGGMFFYERGFRASFFCGKNIFLKKLFAQKQLVCYLIVRKP
jgi:hypothetical protein